LSRGGHSDGGSLERWRAEVGERLRARRAEIEQAALSRTHAVSDPAETADPEYISGLQAAVSAAVDYALAGVEDGERGMQQIPSLLLEQARLAARNDVSLDTVLRRYLGGYTLFGDFLVQEARQSGFEGPDFQELMREQAQLFDRLVAAVSGAYTTEEDARLGTSEMRRAERLQRLLDGELLDKREFDYDFEGHHLGAIASGPGAAEPLRVLSNALDRRLLMVRRSEEAVWAWMGGRREFRQDQIESVLRSWPEGVSLALGEPAHGFAGWRLTHRQALAALPIALRSPQSVVRYADVALLASMLQDDLLVASLREIFLEPLEDDRAGGETARQTLRAYFAAGRNASSAASMMGVSRRTVTNRLRAIEAKLGRSLAEASMEIEAALRLDEL
jgi:PucR C-terminal helix-turn-helix domain/GGDEF-like domain